MRPRSTFDTANIDNIKFAVKNGLTTNHWGSTIFRSIDLFKIKNKRITYLVASSEKQAQYHNLSSVQKMITGFTEYSGKLNLLVEESLFLLNLCHNDNLIDNNTNKLIKNFINNCNNIEHLRFIKRLLSNIYCSMCNTTEQINAILKLIESKKRKNYGLLKFNMINLIKILIH